MIERLALLSRAWLLQAEWRADLIQDFVKLIRQQAGVVQHQSIGGRVDGSVQRNRLATPFIRSTGETIEPVINNDALRPPVVNQLLFCCGSI